MASGQNKISFPVPGEGTDSHRTLLRVAPKDIGYLVMVVEGYEGLGVARTVDQRAGIVEILVSPDFVDDARRLVEAMQKEIEIKIIRI